MMNTGLRKTINTSSRKPGVYLWKRPDGRILYVGKANNLRNRLKNYLHPTDHKTELLVDQSASIETIVTKTESEALILEDALVKQNQPRFNVRLRDDKRYPYIKLTVAEEYPRIQIVRKVETDGSRYFGPFTDAGAVKRIRGLVVELFGIRTCNYDLKKLSRPCIKYSMGKCCAPHIITSKAEYDRRVEQACRFLAGDYRKLKGEV
ncbi:MAG: GIY-YIG nuclease family protein, partial [Candidatus Altiarchaeota archaeon]